MKKILTYLSLAAMILVIAAGCSKSGNDDADSLIKTVPADASSVVVVNLQRTLDKLGCSTDGTTIELSKDLQKAIDESKSVKDRDKQVMKDICEGKTGVAITSLVFFSAARQYLTGLLDDPDKFVEYVRAANSSDSVAAKVEDLDGAKVIDNTVVVGNQFWVCLSGTPDAEQMKYYHNLKEQQSYASTKAAPLLSKNDKAVTFVADINGVMNSMKEGGSMKMAASLMFMDLAYVAGNADMDGKTLKLSANVLNSDMNPAELLLPAEKIDTELVKSFGGDADAYLAVGLSKKLMEKISSVAKTAMGSMAGAVVGPLEQIDGTLAVRSNSAMNEFQAKVETSGKDFAALSNILQNLFGATVTRDGNVITVTSNGVVTGKISASDAAGKMKGAWIGCVVNDMPAKGMTSVARLTSDKKSLRFDMEVDGGVDAVMTALMQ